MTHPAFQNDFLSPQNLLVLEAYTVRTATAKSTVEEFDGWLERINQLPNLSGEDLTTLHGQLIAGGYLKFEIGSSSVGLRYQISPKGKSALERRRFEELDSDEAEKDTTSEVIPDVTADAESLDKVAPAEAA